MKVTAASSTATDDQRVGALAAVFAGVGADASVHALDLDSGATAAFNEDQPWVLGSVFKVPIMLAFAAETAAGRIDPLARITIGSGRTPGPTGVSALRDPVEMSLRDLAFLMITVSDNAAADIVLEHVGLDRVNDHLCALALTNTVIRGNCREVYRSITAEIGPEVLAERRSLTDLEPGVVARLSALDPRHASVGTAREMTRLLGAIWNDEAGTPAGCAEVRRSMEGQVWLHRLASVMPAGGSYAGKTGTLPGVRNEIGVVTDEAGRRFALAVFTKAHDFREHRPDIDHAIGDAGRIAVGLLQEPKA